MPSHYLLRINSQLLGMTLTILHGVALARGPWPHYIPAPHNLIPGQSSPHHWAFAPAAPLLGGFVPAPFSPLLCACLVGYPVVIFLALICYAFDLHLLLSL